jgi:hypothetical protein
MLAFCFIPRVLQNVTKKAGCNNRRGARLWRAAGLCAERKALMAASHLCLERGLKKRII